MQSGKYRSNQNWAKHVKIYGETQNDPIVHVQVADAVHGEALHHLPLRHVPHHVSSLLHRLNGSAGQAAPWW